jgi:translation initiation factor IF-1
MARSDLIELDGTVVKAANGIYSVECENGHIVTATLKKRLKRFRIRVVLGDRVKVGVSPYDPSRGFITYRHS